MQRLHRRSLLGLLTLLLALSPAASRAEATQSSVYIALGDSLAIGVGATRPALLGYVPRLFSYFHGTAHAGVDSLVNVAVAGETSTSLLSGPQLTKALAAINDPTTDIRVLTLDIGGNDLVALLSQDPCASDPRGELCRHAVGAALQTFANNYAQILARLTAALALDPGDETLIAMTYFNYLSGTGDALEPIVDEVLLGPDSVVKCTAPQASWGLNDIITCVAMQYGVAVADVYPSFSGKGAVLTHIAEGDFHPNNAGYAMITTAFVRASQSDKE